MEPVRVAVEAMDAFTVAGLANQLRARPEVRIVPRDELPERGVLVVGLDRLSGTEPVLSRSAKVPKVVVTDQPSEEGLWLAIQCRVVAVLPRAAGDRLVPELVAAATGNGAMPPDVMTGLLEHVRQGTGPAGRPRLSPREVDVLRLMADGWETPDIASKLCYSERTVKNVIYSLTSRLKLRSRPHAVAFAVRAGLI